MKLTIQFKLQPTIGQAILLFDTLYKFNEAASFAARLGFDNREFHQSAIHKLAYYKIRKRFGLSAQLTVRAIGKAVECFARDKTICPNFRRDGAIAYDYPRNISFKGTNKVSIDTLNGREIIDTVYGKYQAERFHLIKGRCSLICKNNKFYLMAIIDIQEPLQTIVNDYIGADLGIVNIATTDDNNTFSGNQIDTIRKRLSRARKTYQRRNTRSTRRRLRKLAGRQRRFQRNINHIISKKIVAKALCENKGIAIENLTGIRTSTEKTVRQSQRSRHSNWAFYQLRTFLTYKAKLNGVSLVAVDPRNTSRTCSACGYCDKKNRKSQENFVCMSCGYEINADQNGAKNIRSRALGLSIKQPDLVAAPPQKRPSYKQSTLTDCA